MRSVGVGERRGLSLALCFPDSSADIRLKRLSQVAPPRPRQRGVDPEPRPDGLDCRAAAVARRRGNETRGRRRQKAKKGRKERGKWRDWRESTEALQTASFLSVSDSLHPRPPQPSVSPRRQRNRPSASWSRCWGDDRPGAEGRVGGAAQVSFISSSSPRSS